MLALDNVLFDVMVTNPDAPYNASHGFAAVLGHHEGRKKRKYKDMSAQANAQFVPFVLDVHGRFGDDALKFIERIAAFAGTQQTTYTAAHIRNTLLSEISVALHKCNALMMQKAMVKIRTIQADARRDRALTRELTLAAMDED
jgi:hypothetical protein